MLNIFSDIMRRRYGNEKGITILEVVGSRTKAKVVKNKVAAPFRVAEFDILYGAGISYEADVLNAGIKYGVVTKSGSSYSLNGEKLGVGFDTVREKLVTDKKLLKEIEKTILEKDKKGEISVAGAEAE